MKKPFAFFLLLVVVVAAVVTGCGSREIVIGALVSTTNAQGTAPEGVAVLRGMELAVDELNEEGGIGGNTVVIQHVDAQADPEVARSAFEQMEELRPLYYISTLSTISEVVAELAEQASVPLLATVASAPGIASGKRWTFRYWPQVTDELEPTLRLIDRIGPQNLALIHSQESYGESFVPLFAPALEERGVSVDVIGYPADTTSFSPSRWEIEAYDALFLVGFASHLSLLLPAVKNTGYPGSVVTTNQMSPPQLRSLPSMEGVYLTTTALYNPSRPFARRFIERYEDTYDVAVDHNAGAGYDVVMLVAQLLEDHEASRESARDLLERGFNFSGVNGNVETRRGDHDFTFRFLPVRVRDGRPDYL